VNVTGTSTSATSTVTRSSHGTTTTIAPSSEATASSFPESFANPSVGHKSSLSTGAKVGIGVAAGVAGIFCLFAVLFLCRRRRARTAGWNAKGVNTRELYGDDGVHSAYALNGGPHYVESPIGAAITTENKSPLGPSGFVPTTREIYQDEEEEGPSPNEGRMIPQDSRPASDAYYSPQPIRDSRPASEAYFNSSNQPAQHDSRPASQAAARSLASSDPRPLSDVSVSSPTMKPGVIPRKEIASPTPPAASRAVYSPSPTPGQRAGTESRSESRLRGPVPEMYAFGGEEIANDEELERLEEEERRIDAAIQESERLERMREEREEVRRKIDEGRRQRESMG
jgi:hypothetical protein